MGFFKRLTKTVVDTALLPVDVALDVVTLGGVLTDRDDPYTVERGRKLKENAEELYDILDD